MCYTEDMDTTTTMSTADKVAAIEDSGMQVAFNDCHKVYIVSSDEVDEAVSNGYSIYPANLIREIIGRSCPLVFVSHWHLEAHPWDIDQCTEDIFEAAEGRA